jgi:ankyrin repeat protein
MTWFLKHVFTLVVVSICIGTSAWAGLDEDLLTAVQSRNKTKVTQLLAAGANPNAKGGGRGRRTALHYAVIFRGDKPITELLLQAGAQVDGQGGFGTPLIESASWGNTEVVEVLRSKGADVNARNWEGTTALMYAAHGGHRATVELLLANGADVNAQTQSHVTALAMASQEGYPEMVDLLLLKGADVHVADTSGDTALHRFFRGTGGASRFMTAYGAMVRRGDPAVPRLLLAKGADASARNIEGQTPLFLCEKNPQRCPPETMQILSKAVATDGSGSRKQP